MARGERDARVARMSGAMVHRGPDDHGSFSGERVSLGFRRLAVIDLETGRQPIRLEGDRSVIVLNGEIYNYRELRRELTPRHVFRSSGDVEVVLRLYAEEGIDALKRLRGMFALALWDRSKQTLYLVRDRFGIKPLFVCVAGETLAFASELKALLAGGFPARRELDRLELRHYLFQKYPSPGGSILEGVRALLPGTVLEIGPAGTREYRYWDPPADAGGAVSEGDTLSRFADLLRAAVRRQLVADVPLGVFLSGGLDSSTLTAIVREAWPGSLETFSVGIDGGGSVSELPWAARVSRRLGSVHHELRMDAREVASDLDAILESLDGPLGDATTIPTWYLSRLARERVTVALSGEGADEIFGGYPRQRYDTQIDSLGRLGRWLLPMALRLLGKAPSARFRRRLRMRPGLGRQLDWSRVFTDESIDDLVAEPLPSEDEMLGLHARLAEQWERTARVDAVNARLDLDRELFLPGDLLPKVDRMSMTHSLEVRVPYLDEDLVNFVTRLPGRYKVRGREGKVLLRRFATSILPQGVVSRPKQGFDVPIAAWLRGPLREALTDYLSLETTRRRGLFRPERVSALVSEHLDGVADHGEPLWLLLVLEGWQQRVLDRAVGAHA